MTCATLPITPCSTFAVQPEARPLAANQLGWLAQAGVEAMLLAMAFAAATRLLAESAASGGQRRRRPYFPRTGRKVAPTGA